MKILFLTILLLITNIPILLSQNFIIKCDTINFGFKDGPFLEVANNLFDEIPLSNYLGMDKTESIPLQKNGLYFEYSLRINKPGFIRLVNADILAIPGQQVNGTLNNGEYLVLKDSNNINFFFVELLKKIVLIKLQNNKDISLQNFLLLYDTIKTIINQQIKFVSTSENRIRYNVDFWVISYLKQYFMAELGNFLFSPTWLKQDFDMSTFKRYRKDITITDAKILLEFQMGKTFLQRYFFYYALPENKYDLAKTFTSDGIFKDNEIQKYLGFRYFSRLYADKNILTKIQNFDTAFSLFSRSYAFTKDQQTALKNLKIRIDGNKSTILSFIIKDDVVKPDGGIISREDKLHIFGGNTILYFWASWCLPCRQFLEGVKSNIFFYKGKPYTMIFVSIDTDILKWKKIQYPFFNASNSFKIADPDNSNLLKTYELGKAIPRVLLLQDGKLFESNVDKHQLQQK